MDTQLETRIVSLTVTSPADVKCEKTEVIYCGVKFDSNAVYHERFALIPRFPLKPETLQKSLPRFSPALLFLNIN